MINIFQIFGLLDKILIIELNFCTAKAIVYDAVKFFFRKLFTDLCDEKLQHSIAHSTRNDGDGVVVRASASRSVDRGFIPLVESNRKTLKMVSIASLLGARHK